MCVKLHTVCKITHCVSHYTLCIKLHTLEVVKLHILFNIKAVSFTYPLENFTLDWIFLHNQRLWWLWQIWSMLLTLVQPEPSASPGRSKVPSLYITCHVRLCFWENGIVDLVLRRDAPHPCLSDGDGCKPENESGYTRDLKSLCISFDESKPNKGPVEVSEEICFLWPARF